jgi:gamma-butyrobetaine dioxygenase
MSRKQVQISEARLEDRLLVVSWSDENTSLFHPIWLRDNCRCNICGDPTIGYRSLRLTDIDLDSSPSSFNAMPAQLSIEWQDGHQSSYPASWLLEHAYDDSRRERSFKPRLWDDSVRRNPPSYQYSELADDSCLLKMLQQVRDLGLCFIHAAPAEPGIAEMLALRFGILQESNFGKVQDLIFDPEQRSIAYDIKALKPHTDEPYRSSPPGIMLFHCVANDQTGAGASTFLDGFEIAEMLRSHDHEGFNALCNNSQAFRRHYENDVDLISEFPVLSTDDFGNLCGVRINDRVAAPLSIAADQVETYYRGLRYLLQLSEDPALALHLTLQPGDIVVFDNHRVLHGRTDLTVEGQRWLQWLQIKRGDFHSSLRIIADRLELERDTNPLLKGAYGK